MFQSVPKVFFFIEKFVELFSKGKKSVTNDYLSKYCFVFEITTVEGLHMSLLNKLDRQLIKIITVYATKIQP